MSSMIYFLILAIVSITGKVAASSSYSNARARRSRRKQFGPSTVGAEKVEMSVLHSDLDEKAAHESGRESFELTGGDNGGVNGLGPDLPMYRIRRTFFGLCFDSGTPGSVSGGKLGATVKEKEGQEKKEDLLAQRKKLKGTLRIIIPGGDSEVSKRSPCPSDVLIPSSFNFYAAQGRDACGQHTNATSFKGLSHLATTRKVPRLRYTHANGVRSTPPGIDQLDQSCKSVQAATGFVPVDGSTMLSEESQGGLDLISMPGQARTCGIERVGILAVEQKERRRIPGMRVTAG